MCARNVSTSVTGVKVGLDAAGVPGELEGAGAAPLLGPDAAGRSKGRTMAITAPISAATTMMAMPMISRCRGGGLIRDPQGQRGWCRGMGLSAVPAVGELLRGRRLDRCRTGRGERRRGRTAGPGMLDAGDESGHVGRERAVPKRQRLPVDQGPNRLRKFGRGGHQGVLDQDRDDPDAALQGDADLLHDPVGRVVDAPTPLVVGEADPAIADEGQQDVTAADGPAYEVGEVRAGRDGVDVHEEFELLAQPISDPTRDVLGVGAPIAQEHPDPIGHQSSSLAPSDGARPVRASGHARTVHHCRSGAHPRGRKRRNCQPAEEAPRLRSAGVTTRVLVRFWTWPRAAAPRCCPAQTNVSDVPCGEQIHR